MIYTDSCNDKIKNDLRLNGIRIIVRNKEQWDIPHIMTHICNIDINLIIINNLNEISIAEITLASLFSKKVLVTDKLITQYDYPIKNLIDIIDISCNLNNINNNFLEWYKNENIK